MIFKIKCILAILICLSCSYAYASDCLIKDRSIKGISIGDTKDKIFSKFASEYQIIEERKPNHTPVLILSKNKRKIIQFEIDESNKILFISTNDCRTIENISSGSLMRDAIKVYGKANIDPTDEGYLISFDSIKGLSFLLDNATIPKRLRNIPDDVITEKQEKEIFNLKNVRIKSIKIFGIY